MFYCLPVRLDSVPILTMLTILRPSLDQMEHERAPSRMPHGSTHHPSVIHHH
jgi:hypothetical protein